MDLKLHKLARTIPPTRRYIQISPKSAAALVRELGVAVTTIWDSTLFGLHQIKRALSHQGLKMLRKYNGLFGKIATFRMLYAVTFMVNREPEVLRLERGVTKATGWCISLLSNFSLANLLEAKGRYLMIYKQFVNVCVALVVCFCSFSLANAQTVRKGSEEFDVFLSYRINGKIWQKPCLRPRAYPMPKTSNMNFFQGADLTPRIFRTSYSVSVDTQLGSVRLGQVEYGSRCSTSFGICFLAYPAPVGTACNCGPYWGYVIV